MKYCTNCGNKILNLKSFCSNCGQKTQLFDYYIDENNKENKMSVEDNFGDEKEVLNNKQKNKNETKTNYFKISLITIIITVIILYVLNPFNDKYPDSQQEFLDLYCNVNWHITKVEVEKIYNSEGAILNTVLGLNKSDFQELFNINIKDKNAFYKTITGYSDDYIVEYNQSYDFDKGEYTYSIEETEVFKNPEGKFMFFNSFSSTDTYGVLSGNVYTEEERTHYNSIINEISTEKVKIKTIVFFENYGVSVVFNAVVTPIEPEIDGSHNLNKWE